MKSLLRTLKKIPWWGYLCGFFYFGLQYGLYRLGELLSRVIGTAAHPLPCKIPFLDDRIPLIPVFVIIYVYSYIFWIMGPIAVSLTSKRNFVNYLWGISLAYLIGFLIFIFVPTYMDRAAEGLYEAVAGGGFFKDMLKTVYEADGSTIAYNLFPSYHCLISLYHYLGIRKQQEIPKGFRVYSLVMVILICMSTVFTKQHYIIDTVGGLGISLGCYLLMRKLDPGKKYE